MHLRESNAYAVFNTSVLYYALATIFAGGMLPVCVAKAGKALKIKTDISGVIVHKSTQTRFIDTSQPDEGNAEPNQNRRC